MNITSLRIANFRAIETAEFFFKPGFNLIVGVNGVGKSTVLDALRTMMSHFLPLVSDCRSRPFSFTAADIRASSQFLDITMFVSLGGEIFQSTSRKWANSVAVDEEANLAQLRREVLEGSRLRKRPRKLLRDLAESQHVQDSHQIQADRNVMRAAAKREAARPNCIFFGTNRSVIERSVARGAVAGDIGSAYALGLAPRPWQLRHFASWMKAQEALGEEHPLARHHLKVLNQAASSFLPDYVAYRPDEEATTLFVNRNGVTLGVDQLSDGEKGVLAIVLDLARRLSQANPELSNPLDVLG